MSTARSHYDVIDKLREVLQDNPLINTVTYGNIYDAATDKTTLFPLAHFTVNNVELNEQTFTFDMTLFCADIIDQTNESAEDKFRGNNNTMDIHNSMLAVISDTLLRFRRKEFRDLNITLLGTPTFEAFTHRFNADTAGWFCDFRVEVLQDMNVGC